MLVVVLPAVVGLAADVLANVPTEKLVSASGIALPISVESRYRLNAKSAALYVAVSFLSSSIIILCVSMTVALCYC